MQRKSPSHVPSVWQVLVKATPDGTSPDAQRMAHEPSKSVLEQDTL
jgi:hypothetical protein